MTEKKMHLSGFKECDLRGEFGTEIDGELANRLGRAIGSAVKEPGVILGGDFRVSTPGLMNELRRGLVESGATVYDLGQISTPSYYFARRQLGIKAGVMVTASHSPPVYNGFKPILGDLPVTPEELEELKQAVIKGEFRYGHGTVVPTEIKKDYVSWLVNRFEALAGKEVKVIFDCGNGATGWVIDDVLKGLKLGAGVLFSKPDGRFPNRSPDIAGPEDLAKLQKAVRENGADIGAGFDGDGDRVGFVDERGQRVPSDRLIAWLSTRLLKQEQSGSVVYDVKLSKVVPETVEKFGGRAIVQKSGHTFIKQAMIEFGAVLGGEYTGHLFYKELDGGDDGLFSALLVCSLLAEEGKPFSEMFADLPHYYSTPDLRVRHKGDKKKLIEGAISHAGSQGARLLLVDGVRAEYPDGWALMRASVTEPAFTFRFEGNARSDMVDVARRFLSGLGEIGDEVLVKVEAYGEE